jgi:predicted DNA-binding transcriptional regulator AlpA
VNSLQDLADGPQPADLSRVANDRLLTIADIREIFGLGRTAANELTHRPDFPNHVRVSRRCYRWWASEVNAFAEAWRREDAPTVPSASENPAPGFPPRTSRPAMPPESPTKGNRR